MSKLCYYTLYSLSMKTKGIIFVWVKGAILEHIIIIIIIIIIFTLW